MCATMTSLASELVIYDMIRALRTIAIGQGISRRRIYQIINQRQVGAVGRNAYMVLLRIYGQIAYKRLQSRLKPISCQ